MPHHVDAVVLVRRVKTTPRTLLRALTEPEQMGQWVAPGDDVRVTGSDARDDGGYHVVMQSSDGSVTFELTPAGDGTELLLRHDGRHVKRWNASLRRLGRMFA